MFVQNWQSDLNLSTRALFYTNVARFQLQGYLEAVTVKTFRVALARLRVSSHRLEVETGRWGRTNRKELADRKCNLCNILEDEYHTILYLSVRHILSCGIATFQDTTELGQTCTNA